MTTTPTTLDPMANGLDLSPALRADLEEDGEDGAPWYAYRYVPLDGAYLTQAGAWHIVWSSAYGRAGVVWEGNGSDGRTIWTDARSPEEALQRVLDDDIRP